MDSTDSMDSIGGSPKSASRKAFYFIPGAKQLPFFQGYTNSHRGVVVGGGGKWLGLTIHPHPPTKSLKKKSLGRLT